MRLAVEIRQTENTDSQLGGLVPQSVRETGWGEKGCFARADVIETRGRQSVNS